MKPANPAPAPKAGNLVPPTPEGKTDETAAGATAAAKFVPRKIRSVSVTILRQADNMAVYVRFIAAPYTGKEMKSATKMAPARLVMVDNLETGEQQQMILNSVLESALGENYPEWTWIGRSFTVIPHKPDEGRSKRYRTYTIDEIETPPGMPEVPPVKYDPALDVTLPKPAPAAG